MNTKITHLETATEPIGIELVLDQLNENEDAQTREILQVYIAAAREYAESFTRRQIIPATCETTLCRLNGVMELKVLPFIRLVSIQYYDADNVLQTIAEDEYRVDDSGLFARIYFNDYTANNPYAYYAAGNYTPYYNYSTAQSFYSAYNYASAYTLYNRADAVKITYEAGYDGEVNKLPKKIEQAMLLIIGEWYKNREDNRREIPRASDILLGMEQVITIH